MGQSWYQLDWIWTTTGWLLAAAGLALLLWALFYDRAGGRKRCPKCWYDMSGAVAKLHDGPEEFTCPECGRVSRGVRRLKRTRRKWLALPLVALLLLAAYTAQRVPAALQHGWVRLIPSTYLACWAPADLRDPRNLPSAWSVSFAPPGPVSPKQALSDEAWRRVTEHENWDWQTRVFVGRALRATTHGLQSDVFVPPRWVVNEPLQTLVSTLNHNRYWEFTLALDDARWRDTPEYPSQRGSIGAFSSPGTREVEVPLVLLHGKAVVYREVVRREVTFLKSHADLIQPMPPSTATDEAVRDAIEARIEMRPDDRPLISMATGHATHPWLPPNLHIGLAIEIRSGDTILGTANHILARTLDPITPRTALHVQWNDSALDSNSIPATVTLHIRGDADIAWASFLPFQYCESAPTYWAGTIDVETPITRVQHP
jgi:hypothetical protein